MPYLTHEQIQELSDTSLTSRSVIVSRGDSRQAFRLIANVRHGMKGVVWRGTDDLGQQVAVKFIPAVEYRDRSLLDEMTEVSKVARRCFAAVNFFGDAVVAGITLSTTYKCVVTEWIEGIALDEFVQHSTFGVADFLVLSEQLFTALAVLRDAALCHDDLHPGNILLHKTKDALTGEQLLAVTVIDSGTIKRVETRELLLAQLQVQLGNLRTACADETTIHELQAFLAWKTPDDHLRAVESLLYAANKLTCLYSRLDFSERRFVDGLQSLFDRLTDDDLTRRLDAPSQVVDELRALSRASRRTEGEEVLRLASPFDYISAEMIRNDKEFTALFSKECPWLHECQALEPLYIYGPRGCGKSSVLRWLAFKTRLADPARQLLIDSREVGVYVSCSVELRSRFWLFTPELIDTLQAPILRFFSLLLLEELFDTLDLMMSLEAVGSFDFGFATNAQQAFTLWVLQRINQPDEAARLRLQGQGYFAYLKTMARKMKWDAWSDIQSSSPGPFLPDPAIISDICRALSDYFAYFRSRHVVFLLDDYSNQRIPASLQRKLNQTISFAKQGTPIFKVASEYQGVDLEGIQEGREVVEINIGGKYTSLDDSAGAAFLTDIIDIRLNKAKYDGRISQLLGEARYGNGSMPRAIATETSDVPFYYHGIDTVHWLCSGDVALALNLIRKMFEANEVNPTTTSTLPAHGQDAVIQQFAHDEIKRIKYIVPYGDRMYDIVCYLGIIARVFVTNKRSDRKDRPGEPICKTHIDVRSIALQALQEEGGDLANLYRSLTSRAILISLETSRSRIAGSTERLQMRRIFFPAFKAPVKRDVPIKLDHVDDIKSLLTNPRTFAEREMRRASIDPSQLQFAVEVARVKPKD